MANDALICLHPGNGNSDAKLEIAEALAVSGAGGFRSWGGLID